MIDDIIKRFDKQFPNLYTGGSFIANGLVKSFIRTEYQNLVKEIVDEIVEELDDKYLIMEQNQVGTWSKWSTVKALKQSLLQKFGGTK